MVGIFHENNFPVFPVDPVYEDIIPDVRPPESYERFFKGPPVRCREEQPRSRGPEDSEGMPVNSFTTPGTL